MPDSKVRNLGPTAESPKRLNSWKEIAAYFSRDVRTVRRWESELGLPIHWRQHTRRGIVYAYQSELDAWWEDSRRPSEKINESLTHASLLMAAITVAGLLLLAGAYFAWVHFRRNYTSRPFEIVETKTLTSTGRSGKAVISPDGRYLRIAPHRVLPAAYRAATARERFLPCAFRQPSR